MMIEIGHKVSIVILALPVVIFMMKTVSILVIEMFRKMQ